MIPIIVSLLLTAGYMYIGFSVATATDGAVIAPRDAVVEVGGEVSFECKTNLSDSYPDLVYTISHNQTVVKGPIQAEESSGDGFTLIEYRFKIGSYSDGGHYNCTVEEGSLKGIDSTTLTIVELDKKPTFVRKGGSTTLRCVAQSVDPNQLEIHWQYMYNDRVRTTNEIDVANVDSLKNVSCTVATKSAIHRYGNMSSAVDAKAAVTNYKDVKTYSIRKEKGGSTISITIHPWTQDILIAWSTNANGSTLNDTLNHDGNTMTSLVNVTADAFPVNIRIDKEGRMVWNYTVELDDDSDSGDRGNLPVAILVAIVCACVVPIIAIVVVVVILYKRKQRARRTTQNGDVSEVGHERVPLN